MTDSAGMNIRILRERRVWTQEHLAAVSGVDVRTIQRAEGGARVAAETLQAVAAAFDLTVADLRQTTTPAASEAPDRFKLIRLQRIDRASDLQHLFPADACQMTTLAAADETQEDVIAALERDMGDLNDLWSDLDPVQRLDYVRGLQSHVDTLAESGLIVAAAVDALELRASLTNREFTLNLLHVVISTASDPKLFAMWDRAAPVSFR